MPERQITRSVSPITLEDAALVQQAAEGDITAFDRLVCKYQDRIVNLCWRISGRFEDAQDLAQEAFLHAFEKLSSYRQQANFYTWLYRIAINESLSHRRKRRPVTLALHDGDGARIGESEGGRGTLATGRSEEPIMRLSGREVQDKLMEGIESLDDDYRAVLVLRDIERFDYQQIADVLEISLGTVKSRLHRARMALRQKLQPYLGPADA